MSRDGNAKGNAGKGRPKGSRNKLTSDAKEAIMMAFDKLGGVDRLVAWVKKDPGNETLFWTRIFSRVVPRPAAEPAAEAQAPVVVKGALVWEKPTAPPYPPMSTALAAITAGAPAGPAPGLDETFEPPI